MSSIFFSFRATIIGYGWCCCYCRHLISGRLFWCISRCKVHRHTGKPIKSFRIIITSLGKLLANNNHNNKKADKKRKKNTGQNNNNNNSKKVLQFHAFCFPTYLLIAQNALLCMPFSSERFGIDSSYHSLFNHLIHLVGECCYCVSCCCILCQLVSKLKNKPIHSGLAAIFRCIKLHKPSHTQQIQ